MSSPFRTITPEIDYIANGENPSRFSARNGNNTTLLGYNGVHEESATERRRRHRTEHLHPLTDTDSPMLVPNNQMYNSPITPLLGLGLVSPGGSRASTLTRRGRTSSSLAVDTVIEREEKRNNVDAADASAAPQTVINSALGMNNIPPQFAPPEFDHAVARSYVRRIPHEDTPSRASTEYPRQSINLLQDIDDRHPLLRPFFRFKKLFVKTVRKGRRTEQRMCCGLCPYPDRTTTILFSDWKKAKIRTLRQRVFEARQLHLRLNFIDRTRLRINQAYRIIKMKSMEAQEVGGVSMDRLQSEKEKLDHLERRLYLYSIHTQRGMEKLKALNKRVFHWFFGTKHQDVSKFRWNDLDAEDRSFVKSVIIDIGYCLSIYDVPAYRLEETLVFLAATYGLDIDLQVTPTTFLISFHDFLADEIGKKIARNGAPNMEMADLEEKIIALIHSVQAQHTDGTPLVDKAGFKTVEETSGAKESSESPVDDLMDTAVDDEGSVSTGDGESKKESQSPAPVLKKKKASKADVSPALVHEAKEKLIAAVSGRDDPLDSSPTPVDSSPASTPDDEPEQVASTVKGSFNVVDGKATEMPDEEETSSSKSVSQVASDIVDSLSSSSKKKSHKPKLSKEAISEKDIKNAEVTLEEAEKNRFNPLHGWQSPQRGSFTIEKMLQTTPTSSERPRSYSVSDVGTVGEMRRRRGGMPAPTASTPLGETLSPQESVGSIFPDDTRPTEIPGIQIDSSPHPSSTPTTQPISFRFPVTPEDSPREHSPSEIKLHLNSPSVESAGISSPTAAHRPGLNTSINRDRGGNMTPVEESAEKEEEEAKASLLPSENFLVGNTTHFVTIPSQSLDLTKLILLERLADSLQLNGIQLQSAHEEMRKILRYRPVTDTYPFQVASALMTTTSFAVFLDANIVEILATFVAACLIVVADLMLSLTPNLRRMYISLAALIGGGVALTFKRIFADSEYGVNTFLVALASVVLFLPGLGITVAFAELSERKIQSGILRLMESLVSSFKLSIGILMANSLERIFFPDSYGDVNPAYENPPWAYAVAVVFATVGFGIGFRTPLYFLSVFFTILASYACFFSSSYLTEVIGQELSTVIGSLILGVFAQVYARITGHPALVVSSVAILLLVPGSLMLRSVQMQFVEKDSSGALEFVFQTAITAIALTIGLSISKVLVPSNKKLNLI